MIHMGSLNPSPEITLDFRPTFIPKTIGQFLGEVSRISNVTEKLLQVDDFVKRLETETRKIEAFKDLPLCMLLMNDAIYALKEESMMLKKTPNSEPVLEEFISLKNNCDDDSKLEIIEKQYENSDKKNWLSSTQLWNTNENSEEEDVGIKNPMIPCSTQNLQSNIRNGCTPPPPPPSPPPPPQQQVARKQRRCWSAELHRRFIAALQELGGSQAATPKQIRELMQVDGLTNDEVKSHLQKYRLHTRRLPSSYTNQHVGFSKCSNSQLDSPNGPLMNGGDNIVDDEVEDEKSQNYCWN